ncbi:hypothetical protein IWZ01DRAFT_104997 [Phyllosticta capitalensis]
MAPHHASTLPQDPDDDCDDSHLLDRAPSHPIACMQGAFDESIVEAQRAVDYDDQDTLDDPKARRQRLIEDDDYGDSYTAQWRKKNPTAKWHPLWKLVAQISFGVHLLNQQLAKSDKEVSNILKRHVQELDIFLERTTEDFDLALVDIKERISHLKLPLEHVNIFDIMLDDHQFRTSIVDGNEKIEKIVERTARAMNDSLMDVEKGIDAIQELSKYLAAIGCGWADGDEEIMGIYMAMCQNSEGWLECLRSLQQKGNDLGVALVQLGSILNEISKRAGVASRRSVLAARSHDSDIRPGSRSTTNSRSGDSRPRLASPPSSAWATPRSTPIPGDKPLPRAPDSVNPGPTVQATLRRSQSRPPQRAHVVPIEQRFENPRLPPKSPARSMRSVASSENIPVVPHRDKRRQRLPEPRLETPIPPPYAINGSAGSSRATTPRSRSPARSPAPMSRAQLTASPSPSLQARQQNKPSTLRPKSTQSTQTKPPPQQSFANRSSNPFRKRFSREKPSSPKVDSAYSSGSSGSSRSSDENKPDVLTAPGSISSRPGTGYQKSQCNTPRFALFPSSSPRSTPPALSIRSGISGTVSRTTTNTLATNSTLSEMTRPTTSGSNNTSPNKKRGSLKSIRNIFRRSRHGGNKLGPTLEEAE